LKINNEKIRFLCIGILSAVLAFTFLAPTGVLSGINDLISSYTYSFSKKPTEKFKLIGIAIDESSLDKISRRWPWQRSVYGRLIRILDGEGVNTVGIDLALIGKSEDKEDDAALRDTLCSVSCRAVLAYFFDYKKALPVFPLMQENTPCYSLGMINTPMDKDGKVRRLRGFIEVENKSYYSFPLAVSAVFLNRHPQDLAESLPLFKDKTFYINYLLNSKDILRVSFYDVLEGLTGLKKRYGQDFLRGALVVVYPEANIFHDVYPTPLGRMSGGIIHLNGIADIISGRFLKDNHILTIVFLLFSLACVFYLLTHFSFALGGVFASGLLLFNFWAAVLLGSSGMRFDYPRTFFAAALFFTAGSIYKYTSFLAQLLKIKNKATIDPLRGLFTLRYFYYRLGLELKKIYLSRGVFLVFIRMGALKAETEEMTADKIYKLWDKISLLLRHKGSFWSVYSPQEVIGYLLYPPDKISAFVDKLRDELGALFAREGFHPELGLGYLRFKTGYPLQELFFHLSSRLEKEKGGVFFLGDNEITSLFKDTVAVNPQARKKIFLEALDEDIEEKNKQLLSLIESLKEEQAKAKEAFFDVIASLAAALEARDPYTEGHSQRVSDYSLMIADRLGWDKEEKERIKKAALFHDLGKIGIPDIILHKKGRLTEEEYASIKKHGLISVKILKPLKDIAGILPWILHHHERWDGKGYPDGLKGDDIPLASQIIALADSYDAMTTARDYMPALSKDEAVREMLNNRSTQFNPDLVDIFVKIISEGSPLQQK